MMRLLMLMVFIQLVAAWLFLFGDMRLDTVTSSIGPMVRQVTASVGLDWPVAKEHSAASGSAASAQSPAPPSARRSPGPRARSRAKGVRGGAAPRI